MYAKALASFRHTSVFLHNPAAIGKNTLSTLPVSVFYFYSMGDVGGCSALHTMFRTVSFSSAIFAGGDKKGPEDENNNSGNENGVTRGRRLAKSEEEQRREELRIAHIGYSMNNRIHESTKHGSSANSGGGGSSSSNGYFSGTFTYTPGEAQRYAHLQQPTRTTYEAMSENELATLLDTRKEQVRKLREVYERFHYEVDKHFRRTVLDYHDKAMHLSQVHGQIQHSSLRINREALAKLREEQEMLTRDKRLVLFLCVIFVLSFWVWTRRHYIHKEELDLAMVGKREKGRTPRTSRSSMHERREGSSSSSGDEIEELEKVDRALLPRAAAAAGSDRKSEETVALHRVSPSVTGAGSYGVGNWFGNPKRSARYRETAWEKEQREKAYASTTTNDE